MKDDVVLYVDISDIIIQNHSSCWHVLASVDGVYLFSHACLNPDPEPTLLLVSVLAMGSASLTSP